MWVRRREGGWGAVGDARDAHHEVELLVSAEHLVSAHEGAGLQLLQHCHLHTNMS